MSSTNKGNFLPFQSYINALGLTMDGTYKLYPSKYLVLNGSDPSGLVESCNSSFDASNYAKQRKDPFTEISDPNDNNGNYIQQNLGELGDVVCGGDINFLNHEVKDNTMYNETIIQISQSDINKITNVTNFDEENLPLEDTIFINNEATTTNTNPAIVNDEITFTHIMVFFNVYRKVGESVDETTDVYLQDMPMGIYIIDGGQTLNSEQEWITRICSSFGVSDNGFEYSSSFSDDNIDSITQALQNFSEIDADLDDKLNQEYSDFNEVKAYYDEFKNSRHINVPYVQGGWWMVNGKKVTPVVTTDIIEDLQSQIDELKEEINNLKNS